VGSQVSRGEHGTAADYSGTAAIPYNPTVAEDNEKEEEKFDFTPELEGYISLDEARVFALQHARDNRKVYSPYSEVALVFEVVDAGETDDFYEVTLSYLPPGNFQSPGTERITINKAGPIELRQVLSQPVPAKRTGLLIASAAAVVVVVVISVIAVVAVLPRAPRMRFLPLLASRRYMPIYLFRKCSRVIPKTLLDYQWIGSNANQTCGMPTPKIRKPDAGIAGFSGAWVFLLARKDT
jgi:hypothetical protein